MTVHESSVPYITLCEGEVPVAERMLGVRFGRSGRPVGLCYRTEVPGDRDERGVLWARTSQSLSFGDRRPVGKPHWALMHPARQRETMALLRCQKCHGPASRTELGYLFLEMADDRRPVEGMTTAQPPVCLAHAAEGIRRCGHLVDRGYVLIRSRVPRLYGVVGQPYRVGANGLEPAPQRLRPDEAEVPVRYTDRTLLPWVLASQLVRQLRDVTVVDPEHELSTVRFRGSHVIGSFGGLPAAAIARRTAGRLPSRARYPDRHP